MLHSLTKSSFANAWPLVLTTLLALPTSLAAATTAENQWALLVGINKYDRMSNLKYCVGDVEALQDALLRAGFSPDHIITLTDNAADPARKPTKANIERELSVLAEEQCDADDTLLISFSGHGINAAGESYLCASDSNLDTWKTSTLPVSHLLFTMNNSPAAVKMFVVDACRNELLPESVGQFDLLRSLSSIRAAKSELPQGLIVMASCLAGQISIEDESLKRGIFMHYVAEGLTGPADFKAEGNRDGAITPDELFEYAAERTQARSMDQHGWAQQPWRVNESTARVEIALVPEARRALLAASSKNRRDDLATALHQQARQYYSQAVTALGRGDLKSVIQLCSNAIKDDPNFKNAYHMRGMAYQLSGNLKLAIDDFTNAGQAIQVPYQSSSPLQAKSEREVRGTIQRGDILEVTDLQTTKSSTGQETHWVRIASLLRDDPRTQKVQQIEVNGFVKLDQLPAEMTKAQRGRVVHEFQQNRQIPVDTFAYHYRPQYSQDIERQRTAQTLNRVAFGLAIANRFGANTGQTAGIVNGIGQAIGNGSNYGGYRQSTREQIRNRAINYGLQFVR